MGDYENDPMAMCLSRVHLIERTVDVDVCTKTSRDR